MIMIVCMTVIKMMMIIDTDCDNDDYDELWKFMMTLIIFIT